MHLKAQIFNQTNVSSQVPTIVIFFNDWKVYPSGINAGGGESAIVAVAKAFHKKEYRVIACANLPDGDCIHHGIEFWNFGSNYYLSNIEKRLREIGPYYCFAASLAHPFIMLQNHQHCLAKILINHSPSAYASGLEPATVLNLVDRIACVSQAQRSLLMSGNLEPGKIKVIKNGFDPEVFTYNGPQGRDFNTLIFIGRLEMAKGIHIAVAAYANLLQKFPNLKLSVFGESNWDTFKETMPTLEEQMPGIKFYGKVLQSTLAQHIRQAGLLVFPSICFESAGLALVDAQASGCGVLGFNVGGASEYIFDKQCGEVVYEHSVEGLSTALERALLNPQILVEWSRNCEKLARNWTWQDTAQSLLELAQSVELERSKPAAISLPSLPDSCKRTINWQNVTVTTICNDHEIIGNGELLSLEEIEHYCQILSDYSAPILWRGLYLEKTGKPQQALICYENALGRGDPFDWQALFRLSMLQLDRGQISEAKRYAKMILARNPYFYYAEQLNKIISIPD